MRTRASRVEKVEQNRTAVLAAARRVFLAKGYLRATLDAIAEEAGFSKGVVYSQFDSKADLFMVLLDRRIEERAVQNERLVADRAGEDAVLTLLENFERDSRAEAGWTRLLIEFRAVALRDVELLRRYADSHARTLDLLADLLRRIHARADLEPAVEPRTMAEFILAFGAGVTLERAADRTELAWPDVAQMVSRALGLSAVRLETVEGSS
jgi:AcrR family transcriptional regulator